MPEIEVKILEVDVTALRKNLQELGAVSHFAGYLQARFFDFPDRRIIGNGDVLRLRQEGETVILAYKRNLSREGAKVMEETETPVSDAEKMAHILHSLGLEVIKETRKWREEYALDETMVVIDHYEGDLAAIPAFLEIEASNREGLFETVKKLGFKEEDCLSWSTYELMQHYGIKD